MACPHSKPRGRCVMCRMERLERDYGVPEDHIEEDDDE
jgi:hypothetical protein